MKPSRLLWIALLLIFLAGCSSDGISENFSNYTKTKKWNFQANAGQTLHITYQAKLTKGSLELLVLSPDQKTLWKVKGGTNGTQNKAIPIPTSGQYTIQVRAEAAYGSYDMQYALK